LIDPPTTALEATVFRKLTLAAAAGAGYVLGAKAGKERYTQIEAKFREIAGMPAVQNATAAVKDTASGVAESAKASVTEKTSGSSSSSSSSSPDVVVDLGTGTQPVTASPATSSGLGSSTTTTTPVVPGPMPGASASSTAPDITRL
jgi:hypothetical protein